MEFLTVFCFRKRGLKLLKKKLTNSLNLFLFVMNSTKHFYDLFVEIRLILIYSRKF